MGRDAKSVALAKKKVEYVAELVKGDPTLTMSAAGAKVKAKFGSMLYFAKLREAFEAAGGKIGRRGRPRKSGEDGKGVGKRRRKVGRRKVDRAAAAGAKGLSGLQSYMVMISGDKAQVQGFEDKGQVESFIAAKLVEGTSFPAIAVYLRQPLAVEFEV